MPDHMHALITSRSEAADFHRFVRLAKQRSGFAHKRSTGRRLWQDSFFDRSLREDESIIRLVCYIVANPVRAGLVSAASEYPHWGSEVYSREEILDFLTIESRRV
jgi:REP element-mobilizing transposase RayT